MVFAKLWLHPVGRGTSGLKRRFAPDVQAPWPGRYHHRAYADDQFAPNYPHQCPRPLIWYQKINHKNSYSNYGLRFTFYGLLYTKRYVSFRPQTNQSLSLI